MKKLMLIALVLSVGMIAGCRVEGEVGNHAVISMPK
jgi:hypothetical protein